MRFCGNCGKRLSEAAPQTIESVPTLPADTTRQATISPEQLGVLTGADLLERFRQAGLEASGQRRSVTVLFVDLSGFTHLSELLGDEELYELVQKFIRVLVNDVYKYEGMVDKLTGDGLMALFGAPIAHENNAERALRSAVNMLADVDQLSSELDLHGNTLRIHVGLNAGSVIVGGLGGDGLMNYTAIGDSVNLARRLEEAAGPGVILVSESVYRQTRRLFDFEQLAPLNLKNISRPIQAYHVLRPKEKPGTVRGLEGLRAPMIGRETEFRQAQTMVDRLLNDGQGGVVLLVGEGGMGKSRLTSELKEYVSDSRLRILEGHSLTYRKSIAYWIFQEVLRNCLGLPAAAAEAEVRGKLWERANILLGEAAPEKIIYLEHVLSLEPSDPEAAGRIRYLTAGQLRQQIFLAIRDLLVAEAHVRPLLLILEDLHWADDASLELVRFLLDSTRSAPLLILAISRPFEGGAVSAIHERASQRLPERYLFLRLQALPPDQSAQLLKALLTIQDLPDELRAQIIQRSAGLPFYLEEILRMLIDNKIIYLNMTGEQELGAWRLSPGADASAIGVPETLQGLILARFDRLAPLMRRVLQTCSVIGFQFNGQVLREVLFGQENPPKAAEVQQALDYLIEHDFIFHSTDETTPSAGTAADLGEDPYVFRHVLVSDAVYSTLLQRDRRDLHTRAGQAIEKIYAGWIDGQIEVLAGHYLRSPLLDRALHYLILAGEKAARSYANEQAVQYFSQARDVLRKTEHSLQQTVQVYTGLGDGLYTSGDYPSAREAFNSGLEACGARPGTGSLDQMNGETLEWTERKRIVSQLQRKVAQTQESQGDYDKALISLGAAQTLLANKESQYRAEQASILSDTGWVYFRRGNLEQAESTLREALALAEEAGEPDVLASVLNRLAGIFFQRDDSAQAAIFLGRSLVLRQKIGDVVGVARSFNNLGLLDWKQGDLSSALKNFDHSFTLQANLEDVEGLIVLHTNMGLIDLDLGDLAEAEFHFQEALKSASQIGHFFHVCEARMHLALLGVYSGDWRRVLEHGKLGLSGFQELGVHENLLDLRVSLGWAYLELDDSEHLDEIVQQIIEMLNDTAGGTAVLGEGRAQRLFGQIARQRGDLAQARSALEKSVAIFELVSSSIDRARALVDLASLINAYGEHENARALLREARTVFVHSGARLELERLARVEAEF